MIHGHSIGRSTIQTPYPFAPSAHCFALQLQPLQDKIRFEVHAEERLRKWAEEASPARRAGRSTQTGEDREDSDSAEAEPIGRLADRGKGSSSALGASSSSLNRTPEPVSSVRRSSRQTTRKYNVEDLRGNDSGGIGEDDFGSPVPDGNAAALDEGLGKSTSEKEPNGEAERGDGDGVGGAEKGKEGEEEEGEEATGEALDLNFITRGINETTSLLDWRLLRITPADVARSKLRWDIPGGQRNQAPATAFKPEDVWIGAAEVSLAFLNCTVLHSLAYRVLSSQETFDLAHLDRRCRGIHVSLNCTVHSLACKARPF